MGVRIDEAGSHDEARRVDGLLGRLVDAADRDDAAVADAHVGDDAGCAGAVHHRAALDDRVEHLRPQYAGKGLTTRQIVTSAFSTVFRPGASMSESGRA